MFVVMSRSATEAEVLGVKSRILAEGLTPYEHAREDGLLLAVVGELAGRREALMGELGPCPASTGSPRSRARSSSRRASSTPRTP
jgi:hypothetical protein